MIDMFGHRKESILKVNGCQVCIWFNRTYNIIYGLYFTLFVINSFIEFLKFEIMLLWPFFLVLVNMPERNSFS